MSRRTPNMTFFKTVVAGFLGTLVAWIFGFLFLLIMVPKDKGPKARKNSILHLKLNTEIIEKQAAKGINLPEKLNAFGGGNKLGLYEIQKALDYAINHDNIKGIYFNPSNINVMWGSVETIREALVKFKDSGKFIISYSEGYTEKSYYLATVADEIYLYPTGNVELNGIASNQFFLKGAMDKLKIEPKVFRVGTFKSAVEPYIGTKMSDANREQTQVFLNGIWNHFTETVSNARNIPAEKIKSMSDGILVDRPSKAVSFGLVDGLAYEDEILAKLMEKVGAEKTKDLKFVKMQKYIQETQRYLKENANHDNKVAVVFAQGNIVDGKGQDGEIGSAKLVKELRSARENEEVKAVVLRVNSPGGSALASDVIAREVQLIKEKKPMIVSMGDLAASGGYYISAKADRIFAQENTITGSIGVFGLLYDMDQFFNQKLGVTFDRVFTNPMADIGTPTRDMTAEEEQKIQSMVNQIYGDFIGIVKDGRGYPDSIAVDSIAQGRVWIGTDALKLKLVDEIGGLDKAIAFAASEAGLGDEYDILPLPKTKSAIEQIMKSMTETSIGDVKLKNELGEHYQTVKNLRSSILKNGVYMKMPYNYQID